MNSIDESAANSQNNLNGDAALSDFVKKGRSPSEVEDNKLEKQNEKAMKRFASIIDMKSYQPGSLIRLLALIIMIFIVPTQLFCDGFVKEKETILILDL